MASLLGWIRAYRRELAFLPEVEPGNLEPIQVATAKFEKALADGSNVELQRLESLCLLWDLQLPSDKDKKAKIANELEIILKRSLHSAGVDLATELKAAAQDDLCDKARSLISHQMQKNPMPDSILQETKARAIQSLAIRESWLYRDYQAGIGDLMIRESSSPARRFEVIGYRAFEAMIYDGSTEERRWLQRLANTIENLDISRADRFDARVELLRSTLYATAELVKALDSVESDRNLIDLDTLRTANQVLSQRG